jgi:hypothetical protein
MYLPVQAFRKTPDGKHRRHVCVYCDAARKRLARAAAKLAAVA